MKNIGYILTEKRTAGIDDYSTVVALLHKDFVRTFLTPRHRPLTPLVHTGKHN